MFDCMYTLSLPAPYTYLTLPYLLYPTLRIDGVYVLWIDPALFSLSSFSSLSLCLPTWKTKLSENFRMEY